MNTSRPIFFNSTMSMTRQYFTHLKHYSLTGLQFR
jgi:hypothetical protein